MPSTPETPASEMVSVADSGIDARPDPDANSATDAQLAESPVSATDADACLDAASAVETDPWDIDALTRHAECLLDEGQADEAVVLLERVIAFEPGRFDAVIALAEAHAARGDPDSARALYEQAASVAVTDGQAVAARARARELAN